MLARLDTRERESSSDYESTPLRHVRRQIHFSETGTNPRYRPWRELRVVGRRRSNPNEIDFRNLVLFDNASNSTDSMIDTPDTPDTPDTRHAAL